MKHAVYHPLEEEEILANAKEAVLAAAERDESLGSRYAKICWMGMGEDAMRFSSRTVSLTHALAEWLMEEGYAAGIDGVDLSTVLPRTKENWSEDFIQLDRELDWYPSNPQTLSREAGRSRFRLFLSVHSAVQETREQLIPGAQPLVVSLEQVAEFRREGGCSVILHHLLFDGLNDSDVEIAAFADALKEHELLGTEVRLLRYNSCGRSPLVESSRFEEAAAVLSALTPVKVQTSLGSEVRAACGQFIVKDYDDTAELLMIASASADIMNDRKET